MPNITDRLAQKLNARRQNATLRQLPAAAGPGRVDFASNDYLGASRNPALQAEAVKLAEGLGLGASGARLLTGNSELAMTLEAELASALQAEAALLFSSGFAANLGLLQALGSPGDYILLDAWAHASLRDGMKLSPAQGFYFRHNDSVHLESRLQRLQARRGPESQVFVVVESVYSMDGDCAPLSELVRLCHTYDAHLLVDEAHGVGTCGQWGEGLVAALGLSEQVLARVVTFGKALGAHGAAVIGSELVCSYLMNFAHPFVYTTALAPHAVAAALASLRALHHPSEGAYTALQERIAAFNELMGLGPHRSPIYSFVCPDAAGLRQLGNSLQAAGLHVLPIYAPTVPQGQERLRVCLHSFNRYEEIVHLRRVLQSHEGTWQQPICDRH